MNYICLTFSNVPNRLTSEILVALLSELQYDMFEEINSGLKAYIPESLFKEKPVQSILERNDLLSKIEFNSELIHHQNWNKVWESNYEPILVDEVFIHAPFHKKLAHAKYQIEIQPKMSFGTGHHETTKLMIQQMLKLDLTNLKVLDLGSGTGVLAILAEKMGSSKCLAIDYDRNCAINAVENCMNNKSSNITVLEGDINNLGSSLFDIVLANINKNVILDYLPQISNALNENATLLTSGFYKEDLDVIKSEAIKHHLKFGDAIFNNNWCCSRFTKL